ncbi:YgcG family protein [uncultured Anaerovibrio sp.]|uniref:TPM domain-containing protein n=1 Tax=uncultured Anaerovibrio sp. TaxID=361586 RepID=UPI00261B3403|nr:TPM domain-containing protein [uncultured Anaerovibrio sp.]
MKKIFTIFMSLLLLLAFSMPVMAETTKVKKVTNTVTQTEKQVDINTGLPADLAAYSVHDMEGLITPEQAAALDKKLEGIEQKHNVRVVVMTVPKDSRTGTEKGIKAFADDVLNKYYRDEANNNGSIMLVICPSARKWAVTTDNNMRQRITDENGFPAIKEVFLDKIKDHKDDYNAAFNNYADKVDELLTYYEAEGEPWDPANEFSIMGLMLGALCSFGLGYLFVSYLRGRMSNVQHVSQADDYLDRNSVNITHQSDTFLRTTVSRTKRERSESRSSSSSGGSRSNGGGSGSY